ncbi:MAG: SUF system NifU family Fe-S cluster assembly protein [Actinomycetota bacterium]|nr:SUF system NifU family Fe-S cluster assembly protein [Actinomycetota bacterium]
MSALEDLYKEIILDHYRSPRNRGELGEPAHRCEGFNPLCGDEVVVYVVLKDGMIEDIKIGGQGCSISQASASMMSEIINGKSIEEAELIIQAFKEMMDIYESELSGKKDVESTTSNIDLGDLEALQGVVKYPVRIKCATLAWNTLTQSFSEIQDS